VFVLGNASAGGLAVVAVGLEMRLGIVRMRSVLARLLGAASEGISESAC
jgi:hypothetical protein